MKRIFQVLALVIASAAVLLWFVLGAHIGWSKTSVPVRTVDEVTGIEAITYERRFVPGIDFLGAAVVGAGLLAAASVIFPRHKPNQNKLT
jgi:hypothetical protein